MKSLAEYNAFKPEDFEKWLKEGYIKLYGQKLWFKIAFDLRSFHLEEGESSMDTLQNFYGLLSSDGKQSFIDGICLFMGNVTPNDFASLGQGKDHCPISELLVISTSLKLLKPISIFCQNQSWWGYSNLLYDVISCCMSFDCSPKLFNHISQLIYSPFFKEPFIFEAVELLLDCDKEKTLSLMPSLKPRVDSLWDEIKKSGGHEKQIAFWRNSKVSQTFGLQ